MDYKELAERTHLDQRRIKAVMNKDFRALNGCNVAMILKVLERELDIDFSLWHEEYEQWCKENTFESSQPKIAPKLQGFNHSNKGANAGKSSFGLKALLLLLLIVLGSGWLYYDEISQNIAQIFTNLQSNKSSANDEENAQTDVASIIAPAQEHADQTNAQIAASKTDTPKSPEDKTTEQDADNSDIKSANLSEQNAENSAGSEENSAGSKAENSDEKADENTSENTSDEAIDAASSDAAKTADADDTDDAEAADAKELAAENLSLNKPASLSIIPTKVAWLSVKDLTTNKTANFSISKPYKIKSPSLVFVGTTAYNLLLGSKQIKHSSRYFIYDDSGIRFLSKAEYSKLDSRD